MEAALDGCMHYLSVLTMVFACMGAHGGFCMVHAVVYTFMVHGVCDVCCMHSWHAWGVYVGASSV